MKWILGSLILTLATTSLAKSINTITTYGPPVIAPALPSNPTGAIRKASSESNDPVPLFDLLGHNRVDVTNVPNAFCNDGSKPVYYFRQGRGQGSTRWVIWLEGGGGCGTDDATSPYWCGLRKNTTYSTSNNLPIVIAGQGVFSGVKAKNPDFYSYNHVMVHYCSSDFWRGQGIKKSINPATNEQWWFSGQRIVEAVLKDLENKHGFKNASNIILSGTSAGAIGITMNSNMIKSLYPTKDIVTAIDAAWAIPFDRFDESAPGGYRGTAANEPELMFSSYKFTGSLPDSDCMIKINYCPPNARCKDRRQWCMLPGLAAKYLNVPYFAIHDNYDRVLGYLGYRFDVCKYTDKTKYETWLTNHQEAIQPELARSVGFFQTRSGHHGMLTTDYFHNYVANNGNLSYKLKDVFGAWYFSRTSSPSVWMEAVKAGMTPDQEARSKNGCNYVFPNIY